MLMSKLIYILSARQFNYASDKMYERLVLGEFPNNGKEVETKMLYT